MGKPLMESRDQMTAATEGAHLGPVLPQSMQLQRDRGSIGYPPIHPPPQSYTHPPSTHSSFNPSIHPSTYPSIHHPIIHLSIYPSIQTDRQPFIHPLTHPIHLSIDPSTYPIHPSIHPAIQRTPHLAIHPQIYKPSSLTHPPPLIPRWAGAVWDLHPCHGCLQDWLLLQFL